MSFWNRFFGRKASQARMLLSYSQGQAVSTPRNYADMSREAYQKNVVAYRAVTSLAKACAGIPWLLYQGKGKKRREIPEHDLLKLLERPNPTQGQGAFFEALIAFYAISGNSYVEAVTPRPGVAPMELWTLRPDRMKIIPGKYGLVGAYVYCVNQNEKVFPVDPIKGRSAILQLKTFNPLNDWYGMSPIEAAIYSIDQHNYAGRWNLSLLQNEARPSGVLSVKVDDNNPTGTLGNEEYERLKKEIDIHYSGSKNAGKPMLLEGGLAWQGMSFNPKDMDWINAKNTSARDICWVFGYPPLMLGIPGDNTFANYKEARTAFYEDTVIPLMDFVRDELNVWLTPAFGDNLFLDYDRDEIEALAPRRAEKWTQVQTATWLTFNEKREATGYDRVEGGDVILVPSGQTPLDDIGEEDDPNDTSENQNPEPNANGTDEATDSSRDNSSDSGSGQNDNEGGDYVAENSDEAKAKDHGAPEIKLVNLFTRREKEKAWRRTQRRRKEFEKEMADAVAPALRKQAEMIEEAVSKASSQTLIEFAALKAIDESMKEIKQVVSKHIRRAIISFGTQMLENGKSLAPEMDHKAKRRKFDEYVNHFVETRTAESIKHIEGASIKKARSTIRKLLADNIEAGESNQVLAAKLREKFDDLSNSRAITIARTETTIASSQGSLEAAKTLEVPGLRKEWVSIQDDRTRDDPSHADHFSMNGVKVPLDEKFTVPPDASMDGPGDPAADAEQVINCRCVLVYSRGD